MNIQEKSIQAFRRLASGVSIISAGNNTEKYAMTASSVTSVSMEPPSLLVCIHQEAEIVPFLKQHNQFCVNLLNREDETLSNLCATPGKGDERFKSEAWKKTSTHTPFLEDAQANIFCEIERRSQYATHYIYIAKVIEAIYKEPINPLLYMNNQYGSFE